MSCIPVLGSGCLGVVTASDLAHLNCMPCCRAFVCMRDLLASDTHSCMANLLPVSAQPLFHSHPLQVFNSRPGSLLYCRGADALSVNLQQ